MEVESKAMVRLKENTSSSEPEVSMMEELTCSVETVVLLVHLVHIAVKYLTQLEITEHCVLT